jgi:hypothetical protein
LPSTIYQPFSPRNSEIVGLFGAGKPGVFQ